MSANRHPSLEQAFTPPTSRGESLAGLLPPRPHPVATQPAKAKLEDNLDDKADRPAVPRCPRVSAVSAKAATEAGEGTEIFNVAIYLPPDTLAAARAAIRAQDATYADLLVEAFAGIDEDALRAQFAPKPRPAAEVGMPRRSPRARGAAGIQRQFRLSADQCEWLQSKVTYFGAPSRSALAATVLGMHFHTLEP